MWREPPRFLHLHTQPLVLEGDVGLQGGGNNVRGRCASCPESQGPLVKGPGLGGGLPVTITQAHTLSVSPPAGLGHSWLPSSPEARWQEPLQAPFHVTTSSCWSEACLPSFPPSQKMVLRTQNKACNFAPQLGRTV